MLRITVQETEKAIELRLEGRIAGPWVAELGRVLVETAPRLATRKLLVDLRDVTYADAEGKRVLRDIYSQTGAGLIASTPWTQYLVEEVKEAKVDRIDEEIDNA